MQEGIGESIGGLLQALGIGLGAHGQQKMQQQQQQRTRQAFGKAIPGHEYLADLPEVAQKEAFSKLFEGPLEKLFSQRAMEERGQGQENFQQPNPGLQELFGSMGQAPNSAQEGIMNGLRGINIGTPQEQVPNMEPTRGGEKAQERQKKFKNASGFTESEKARIALRNPQLAAQLQRSDLAEEKREFTREESRRNEKFQNAKEYKKFITGKHRAAKESNKLIDEMEDYDMSGKLPHHLFYSIAKALGLDIPALLGPEGEAYNKAVQKFMTRARDTYGARVTNWDAQQFLQSIPTLANTPEGRRLIRESMRLENAAVEAEWTAYQQILKENDGVPPLGIDALAEERAEKIIDQNWKEYQRITQEAADYAVDNPSEEYSQGSKYTIPNPEDAGAPPGSKYVVHGKEGYWIPPNKQEGFVLPEGYEKVGW